MLKSSLYAAIAISGHLLVAGSVSSMATDRLASQRCGDAKNEPAFCKALRGDRKEGWLGQNRSEVMPVTGS
jgi:hypothetical protein